MLMQLSDFLDGYNLDFIKLDVRFFDVGVKMEQQIQEIAGRKQKLVIVVNSDFGSVSVKNFFKTFSLEFGKWLRLGHPVFLVCRTRSAVSTPK